MGGGCVVMGMVGNMRSVGPMHAPHDEEEHQNKKDDETFSTGHGIYRPETTETLNKLRMLMLGKYQRFCQANGRHPHRVVVCHMMSRCRHKSLSRELIPTGNSVY